VKVNKSKQLLIGEFAKSKQLMIGQFDLRERKRKWEHVSHNGKFLLFITIYWKLYFNS